MSDAPKAKAPKLNLELRQAQTLTLTPQLQQAIKLLQLSNLELAEFIEDELAQNPLLEKDEGNQNEPQEAEAEGGDRDDVPSNDEAPSNDETSDDPHNHDDSKDDEWGDAGLSEVSWGNQRRNDLDDSEWGIEQTLATKPSLRDHLLEQIGADFHDVKERLIARELLESLDEAGYFRGDLQVAAEKLGADIDFLESVLIKLQRCDPAGIFARNLEECLRLQLADQGLLDPAMETLLAHLDLLAKHDSGQLKKLCQVDDEGLLAMVEEVKRLNPKPGEPFADHLAQPIIPDVYVKRQNDGDWLVELNTQTMPKILLNQNYYQTVKAQAQNKEDKQYLEQNFRSANWLVKAIHQRATTILKVSSEIVKRQDGFFRYGVTHLKPMVMREIAEATELHESTISRVTSNKYMATPRGLFELKYFFSAALSSTDGEDDLAAESIRHMIKELIENETPQKILSDDEISQILKEQKINVARRTVAKYREAMKIPTSAQRKRQKRSILGKK